MDMVGKIRRLHSRGKKSEREISRVTGLSRNAVAKWLHGPLQGEPKYRRVDQPRKLTTFHEALKQALKVDAHRPRHERRTARALYTEIKGTDYARSRCSRAPPASTHCAPIRQPSRRAIVSQFEM